MGGGLAQDLGEQGFDILAAKMDEQFEPAVGISLFERKCVMEG